MCNPAPHWKKLCFFFVRLVNVVCLMEFDLKFDERGLIPAIVQADAGSPDAGRVLMFAWMNRESLEKSLETGMMHYWSRSRGKLWLKGESSGHVQNITRWAADCDRDVLLFEVKQEGGACHTGHRSCFFQEFDRNGRELPVTDSPAFDPREVYSRA